MSFAASSWLRDTVQWPVSMAALYSVQIEKRIALFPRLCSGYTGIQFMFAPKITLASRAVNQGTYHRVASMSQRTAAKRPLCPSAEPSIAKEELRRAAESAIFYDVLDANGMPFGLCVRAPSGADVYVEPLAMLGLEVGHPMRINGTANAMRLARDLGSEVSQELSR